MSNKERHFGSMGYVLQTGVHLCLLVVAVVDDELFIEH
jgi:hypothetical protein